MRLSKTDLIGQSFGYLTVTHFAGTHPCGKTKKRKRAFWGCRCDCGERIDVRRDLLVRGRVTSCGCQQYKRA